MRDAIFGLGLVLIVFVLGIGFWANYQQSSALRYQLERMNQQWQDSNQSVIRALNMREKLQQESDYERRIIMEIHDDCLDKPVPPRIVKLLVVPPANGDSRQ